VERKKINQSINQILKDPELIHKCDEVMLTESTMKLKRSPQTVYSMNKMALSLKNQLRKNKNLFFWV